MFDLAGNSIQGVILDPPGRGLFTHVQSMNGRFTRDSFRNEIKDTIENGLELASRIDIDQNEDRVLVTMHDLANAGMCNSVRKHYPRVCNQVGCPICSFVGCMVAEGTSRKVMIENVSVEGKKVYLLYKLI
jgi:hypothetical protein